MGERTADKSGDAPQRLLLRLDAAARALDISPRALWGQAKAGVIPVVRIGRCVRFDLRDLIAFIDASKSKAVHT